MTNKITENEFDLGVVQIYELIAELYGKEVSDGLSATEIVRLSVPV